MSNPFSGIITQDLKNLHENMISALLEDDACTVLCTLHYFSKWTDCPNCQFNAVTGKSANKYTSGGPISFPDGQRCPYCLGEGRIQIPETESVWLMPIWDKADFIDIIDIDMADVKAQTMSKTALTYDKLTRCTKITIDEANKRLGITDLVRVGRPQIMGFGRGAFIVTSWGVT